MVRGLANAHAARIVAARGETPYESVEDVWRRSGVPPAALEKLADADAFACFGLSRREALWQVRGLGEAPLPLFAATEDRSLEPEVALARMADGREVVEDYGAVSLSLRAHPLAFLRPELERRGSRPCADLARVKDGARVEIAGLVLIRQRPGKGNVTFITLEDETGIANVILWQRRFEEQRRVVMGAAMLGVKGVLQREGEVVHVIADRLEDLGGLLGSVGERQFPHRYSVADSARGATPDLREKRAREPARTPAPAETAIRVKSRDFH